MKRTAKRDAYQDAGVNIDAGHEAVERMRQHVRTARTPNMLTDIGSFGGLFQLPRGYQQPVLVGSTDGVGTKLLVAGKLRRYDTVGQDLVNHCVNDILVQGAKPLFFMDYFATGKLEPVVAEQIVKGLAQACRENGCALLGGETAEMPGMYQPEDFDLAGTIVGIVERKQIIDGRQIQAKDILIGLPSTGLHTNGFSLARQVLFNQLGYKPDSHIPELSGTVGDLLLTVHRSYLRIVERLREQVTLKGMAHITGGGFIDNIPRILPDRCQAVVRKGSWPVLPLFNYLAAKAKLDETTLYRTFNMGIGMVLVLSPKSAVKALRLLEALNEPAYVIGEVQAGPKRTVLK